MTNKTSILDCKHAVTRYCKGVLRVTAAAGLAVSSTLAFAAPNFSSSFTPSTVGPGSTTKLTYTITNNDGSVATNTSFTALLPAGLLNASPSNVETTCTNGTVTALDGGSSLTFSDYDIAVGNSCSVTLDIVTSNTPGTYQLPVVSLTSSNGNTDTSPTDITVVNSLPGYTIASSPSSINVGAISTLTFTIDNSQNGSVVGNIDTSLNLPAGLVVADVPNITTDCVSALDNTVVTAKAGSNSITLDANGATFSGYEVLAAGAMCTVEVDVKANGIGKLLITSNSLLADFNDSGFATTQIESTQAFALMSFNPNPAVPGSTAELNVSLTNYSRSESATNIAFTDDLNDVISGMSASGLPLSVCGGTISGTSLLSFSGGELAPGETCSFNVPFSVPAGVAIGNYTNTTSSFSFDLNGSSQVWAPVSHNLSITKAPILELNLLNSGSLVDESIVAGDDLIARFTITNIDTVEAVTDINFTSELTKIFPFPVGVSFPTSGFCGAGSSIALAVPSTNVHSLQVTGANLAAGGSCTFDVTIAVPTSQPSGVYTLQTENGSAITGGESQQVLDVSDTFTVITAPTLTMSLPGAVMPGSSVDATLTLRSSGNSETATGVGFSVDLNAALTGLTASSITANTCSQAPTGTSTLTVSNITLASGASCSFIVTLDIPLGASTGTYAILSSSVTGTVDGKSVTSAANSIDLKVVELRGVVETSELTVGPGETTQLNFTLENLSGTTDLSGISFSLNLSSALAGLTVSAPLPTNPCGSGSSITGTSNLIFSGGALLAGGSCSFSIEVLIPVGTSDNTYRLLTSSINVSSPSFVIDPVTANLIVAEDLAPSVLSISSSAFPLTGTSPIAMEIVFSEDVEGFIGSDLVVSNGVVSNLQETSPDKYTFDITPSSDDVTITVQLPAGVVDELGSGTQVNTASSIFSIEYDTSALPSAVINVEAGSKTSSETLSATVSYTNATDVFLTIEKVNLLFTGTASTLNFVDNNTLNPDITVLNGDSSSATIQVSNIIGDGTLIIGLDEQTARNNIGNVTAIANSTNSFSIDNTAPTIEITSSAVDPINGSFVVNFEFLDPVISSTDTSISGFDVTDVILNNANISDFSGNNGSYSATITPVNDGVVTININSGAAKDDHGNDNIAATTFTINYDGTKPSVAISSISSLVNSTFIATINFTESVTGFTLSDIVAGNATLSNFNAISDSNYTVDVAPINDGGVTLNIAENIAVDLANNGNNAATTFNVIYDATQPTVDISGPISPQNSEFTVTFTFSEIVTGFTEGDIVVGNATLSNLQGSGTVYSATVSPINHGNVTLDIGSSVVTDSFGNGNIAATQLIVDYDFVQPTVNISGPTTPQNTPFIATFTFTEEVSGFELLDILVSNGSVSELLGSGNSYTALVSPLADGVVTLNVSASAVTDLAGNENTSSNTLSVAFDTTSPTAIISGPNEAQNGTFSSTITFSENISGMSLSNIMVTNGVASNLTGSGLSYSFEITPTANGEVIVSFAEGGVVDDAGNSNLASNEYRVNYDINSPTVVISGPSTLQNKTFDVTIVFNEEITGFTLNDISVTNGSVINLQGSGLNYLATISPISDGTVNVELAAAVVTDLAGNNNVGSNLFTANVDISSPEVTLTATTFVVNGPFEFIADFSEVVSGLSIRDFNVSGASIGAFSVLSNTSFKVEVIPATVGLITISLPQGAVQDLAGNLSKNSNELKFDFSNELVAVSISAPSKAKSSFNSAINFSRPVSGFELSDIKASNATLSNLKVLDASSYEVSVEGVSVGDITLQVLKNAVLDSYGNKNNASQLVSIAFDNLGPKIISRTPLNNSNKVSINTEFEILFDEDIAIGSGAIKLVNVVENRRVEATEVDVNGSVLQFTFDGSLEEDVRYQLIIENGALLDSFGNLFEGNSDWFFTTSNLAPEAKDDNVSTKEDVKISIDVTANDSDDVELDLASIIVSLPINGTVKVSDLGIVEYTPNQDFYGSDSFTYTIADKSGQRSNQATIFIEVVSVNDAPQFISKPINTAGTGTEYQYDIEVFDVDSDSLTVRVSEAPEWLILMNQVLKGIIPSSAIGQSFEIILEVTDGELTEQQQFTLKVVEFDESLVSIVQGVNVSPILVQEAFELSVMINNASTLSIALEQLSVALEGVEVVSAASGCTFNESSYLCQDVTNIDAEDSLELVFTLRGESAGELTSAVTLTYNQELTKQDTFVQVIAEDISDEKGNKLPLSDVNSFALADFNSDGLIDIAFAANGNSAIFINQGAGKYELGASFLANEDVKHVAVADFNNDGTFDIAFATESELGSGVLYNDGNLVFTDTQIVSSIPSQWVFTFDINDDALNDIILLDDSDNGISIITQPFAVASVLDNTLRQSTAVTESEAEFNDLATGDFDNNGLIDLVLAVDNGPVEIWYQGDNGQFDIQQTQLLNATKLKVFDLNADGILEVVAITKQGLEILEVNNLELQRVSSVSYLSFDIAYLNGNQSPEITVLSESGNISIFEFTSEGYTLLPVVFDAQQGQNIALTDVDLDGDLDLIISSSGDDNEVRFNQGNGMFGEQTTDLVLVSTPESNSLVEGDSFEWNLVVSNQGLANAISPEVTITSDNVVISEIESELLTCSVSDTGVICQYDGELVVEQETSITVSLLASNLGTASVNAYVSNITVDDNHDNNSTQLTLDVSAKPPVVIPEPPKKKSSGGGSYLLVIVIFFLLRRVR
ncbi:Ig-like domain-containing protein [Pseudoalteromonas spongiae]|uniref:Ig-like domain-containing protein n=1 Tax=Pseudoalteromonas spongiae TaxID=298657 RepID=UPI00110AA018|nr:Ig-like domain-containing protein [Pseudoalteromonas spongiae]TMO82045.1 hypothetical protein CWC15_20400 [Pseudoalteromonas spongiae]